MTTANIITYLDQITTEWLISVLTQSETLTCGTVQAFTFDIEQGNWSTSVNLTTTYTDNAQETLPLTPLPQNGGYWYGLKKAFVAVCHLHPTVDGSTGSGRSGT